MLVNADFHVHSCFSMASSKDMLIKNMAPMAKVKGLNILGTGDAFHPKWLDIIEQSTTYSGNGIYNRDDMDFVLTTEVEAKNRIHHLIIIPDIDIAREIAKKLNKELVIKDVAFDSIINEVKSGKADIGAAGISYDAERALEVDFSINYTTSNQVVIVKKDGNIKKISDIKDQKIAVQLGTIADSYLTKNFPDVELVREKKYLAAIEDLKSNKCEAVVMDELPAKAILKNNPSLVILDGWLTSDSYGMIVKKGNKELLEVINEVLKELSEQGKIDSYIIKHSS